MKPVYIGIVMLGVLCGLRFILNPPSWSPEPRLPSASTSIPPTPQALTTPEAAVTPTLPRLDAGAWLACRLFEPLARDANAGVLSNAEFRTGLKQVYEKARTWPDSEVARTSASLLQLFTTGGGGDSEAQARFLALVTACRDWEKRGGKHP
jgi:hypothetical protein